MKRPQETPRRILVAANTQWYLANFRSETIAEFVARGFDVHCAAPADDRGPALSALGATVHDSPPMPSKMSPLADLRAAMWFIAKLRQMKPQAVFSFTPKPNVFLGLSSRATGTAFYPNISGLGRVFEQENLLSAAAAQAYRIALGKAERVIFQNRESRDLFVQRKIVPADRAMELAGSGVDLDRFAAQPMPSGDDFVFLFSGRLVPSKGLHEYVAAARAIGSHAPDGRKIRYRIVGFTQEILSSTMPRSQLDALLAGSPVEYCGPSQDVREQLTRSHCFVLPSYYGEGVPRSAIEAASCGRPIITTDHSGCRETVIDGLNGLLVEPRSAVSLERAMREILAKSRAELDDMARASRALAEGKFDVRDNVRAYLMLADNAVRMP